MKLTGKVAMITGTSPNIGGGIAEELAREGAAIVAVDATRENAEDCAAYLNKIGSRAVGVQCDVCDQAAVEDAVRRGVDAFGKIDVLVNNAAIFNKKGLLEMSLDEWLKQSGVILTGAFLCSKIVAETMVANGTKGSIINVVSTAGHQGEGGNIAYSTSKGALLNFTRSAAMELVAHGIRVNSLTPTATDPAEGYDRARRWGRSNVTEVDISRFGRFLERVPMGKLPRPSDYGKAAVFLASDDAEMITGIDLRVDAGAVAQYWGAQGTPIAGASEPAR